MYFDNIDLGPLNLQHDVFPRIKAFDCTILGKMIQADTYPASDPSNPRFGHSKLRKNPCYSVRVEAQSPSSSNAKNPFNTHNPTLQRKRVFSAVSTSSMSDGSPISTTSAAAPNIFNYAVPNFSAFIRDKYPDHMEDWFVDDLKFHNARCLQHINKANRELTTAIVNENMILANKYMQHQTKQPVSGIPKYPRKNIDQRKRYDDLLSGPESGSEAEDNRNIMHTTKNNVFVRKDDRPGNPMVMLQEISEKNNPIETKSIVHDGFPILTSAGAVKESTSSVEADALETVTPVPEKQAHNANSDVPCFSKISHANSKHGSIYKTPNAITRMAPLSPELSPTSENKLHSDFALSVRMLSSLVSIDLNSRVIDAEYTSSPVQKKTVKLGRFAKSHWSFGQDHPERDPSVTHVLLDWY